MGDGTKVGLAEVLAAMTESYEADRRARELNARFRRLMEEADFPGFLVGPFNHVDAGAVLEEANIRRNDDTGPIRPEMRFKLHLRDGSFHNYVRAAHRIQGVWVLETGYERDPMLTVVTGELFGVEHPLLPGQR